MREKSRESNFIRHWVRVKIEGFRPERLISQAMSEGIPIRRICRKDETEVVVSVAESGFRQMKKMAGSKYKLTVVEEGGVKPFWGRIKRVKMTIAGLDIFALFFISQTFFVREINIIGCESIPEDSIRQCIEKEGLYEGAFRDFDCSAVEKRLFREFENIVWARVAYEGNYVEVQISEGEQNPAEEIDQSAPCNIIAEKECYIEEIQVYSGRGAVSRDDYARKGDVLISGIVPIEHPSYPLDENDAAEHYVHAAGLITARVPYYFSFYMEEGNGQKEAESLLRVWIEENVPEDAQILNKDFHFDQKKNIIRVYGTVETREQVGIEKEIVIDRKERRTEEAAD